MTDLELKHYGVKGMKWGVRKDANTSTSIDNAKKKKKQKLTTKNKIDKTKKVLESRLYSLIGSGRQHIENSSLINMMVQDINNQNMLNEHIRQANEFAMNQANTAAINAGLQAASLSASGGMNPFMFGMM